MRLFMPSCAGWPNSHADADAAASKELSYDGVPLVQLHGDNAEDLALLMNYLYYPERYVLG